MGDEERRAANSYDLSGDFRGAILNINSDLEHTTQRLGSAGRDIYTDQLPPQSPYKAPPLPPKGELPEPGDLPPSSRVVHSRNPYFTGRTDELLDLANTLLYGQGSSTAVISQPAIASGMGGIGKSQLAVEFMYRYGRFFSGGVYWISFSDPEAIGVEIAACDGALNNEERKSFHTLDSLKQELAVRKAWKRHTRRLLVFDNLDDDNAVRLLKRYRPKTGGCSLLVTSRREKWPIKAKVFALPTLPRPDSITLLQQLTDPDAAADPALKEIAHTLGDLPLALHMAGSYLDHYRHTTTPAAYLEKIKDPALLDHPSLTGMMAEESPTDHELHVGKTFALSYERLDPADETDHLALAILARLAYFSPAQAAPPALLPPSWGSLQASERGFKRVWRGVIDSLKGSLHLDDTTKENFQRRLEKIGLGNAAVDALEELNISGMDNEKVDNALSRLNELGLIKREGGSAVIHRLTAAFVRAQPASGDQQAGVEWTLLTEANRINEAGYPRELLPWQSHLRYVTDAAVARGSKHAAGLCNSFGYHLQAIGDLAGARPFFERALAINEKALGPDHPDTALSLNNLGYLLRAMGDLAGARPYVERALAIREKALGPDHPDTATSMNNLAGLFVALGNYEQAKPLREQVLEIFENKLGTEHPWTATALNNLGALLHSSGKSDEAVPYLERAYQIRLAALGDAHPGTARCIWWLGVIAEGSGKIEEARTAYTQAHAIFERALGAAHPTTQQVLDYLNRLNQ